MAKISKHCVRLESLNIQLQKNTYHRNSKNNIENIQNELENCKYCPAIHGCYTNLSFIKSKFEVSNPKKKSRQKKTIGKM